MAPFLCYYPGGEVCIIPLLTSETCSLLPIWAKDIMRKWYEISTFRTETIRAVTVRIVFWHMTSCTLCRWNMLPPSSGYGQWWRRHQLPVCSSPNARRQNSWNGSERLRLGQQITLQEGPWFVLRCPQHSSHLLDGRRQFNDYFGLTKIGNVSIVDWRR